MIKDGKHEVVCPDCGKKFRLVKSEGTFDPANCKSCNGLIKDLEVPKDGSRIILKLL